MAAATEKWGPKAAEVGQQLKAAGKLPVHDGDAKSAYQGYAGKLYLNASSKVRPLVINGDRSPLAETDGKMARAVEDMWAVVKAKTGATDADLPAQVRATLAERAAARAVL